MHPVLTWMKCSAEASRGAFPISPYAMNLSSSDPPAGGVRNWICSLQPAESLQYFSKLNKNSHYTETSAHAYIWQNWSITRLWTSVIEFGVRIAFSFLKLWVVVIKKVAITFHICRRRCLKVQVLSLPQNECILGHATQSPLLDLVKLNLSISEQRGKI